MNNLCYRPTYEKTSSGFTVIMTAGRYRLALNGTFVDNSCDNALSSVTSASLSSMQTMIQDDGTEAIQRLNHNINQLWESLDDGTFSATDKELEVAAMMLNQFPDNTI